VPESPDECLKPKPRPHSYRQPTPGNDLLSGACMHAIVITTPGGPEVLRLEEFTIPCQGPVKCWWR
jgi:hypothetical protein